MKKTTGRWILNILILSALIAMTVYIFVSEYDFNETVDFLSSIDPIYFVGAVALVLLFLGSYGLAVKILLKLIGKRLSLFEGFVYGCTDFYFSAITPSAAGGQPFVGYYMTKAGIPVTQASVAILMHTVFYKVVLILYALIAFVVAPDIVFNTSPVLTAGIFLGFTLTAVILGLCLLCIFSKSVVYKVVDFLIHVGSKLRLVKNVEKKERQLLKAVEDYKRSAALMKASRGTALKVFVTVLVQRSSIFAVSYLAYKSFGLSGHGLLEILVCQVILSLAVDSLPMPGGVCASELAFVTIYTTIYTEDYMAPALLFTRGFTYYFCAALTGIVVFINHLRLIRKKKER